jgi:hypothetical protein
MSIELGRFDSFICVLMCDGCVVVDMAFREIRTSLGELPIVASEQVSNMAFFIIYFAHQK